MIQLLQKLKLYTKLGLETVNNVPYVFTSEFICDHCRLPAPTKVVLQIGHHTTLLFHL